MMRWPWRKKERSAPSADEVRMSEALARIEAASDDIRSRTAAELEQAILHAAAEGDPSSPGAEPLGAGHYDETLVGATWPGDRKATS